MRRAEKKSVHTARYYALRACLVCVCVCVLCVKYKKYSYLTAPLALAVQNALPTFYGTMVVGFSSSEELTAGTFNEVKLNTNSIDHLPDITDNDGSLKFRVNVTALPSNFSVTTTRG